MRFPHPPRLNRPHAANRIPRPTLATVAAALALAAASIALGSVPAQAGEPASPTANRWIHVRVQESGVDAETVRVNCPLSLIEAVLPAIQAEHLRDGKVRINDAEVNSVDVKALLKAVQDAGDAEYVTVEGKDQDVRVAREGDFLIVRVRGADEEIPPPPPVKGRPHAVQTVDVRVPMRVVEAMLSGSGDQLDLIAGIRALAQHNGELVRVSDGESKISVWIDSRNTAPEEQ